ncbi:MAG: hypothetical protein H6717_28470 [Polyangiaceae bacterium]|nr:hypothetical protein [Polyangiaceae bacterium]
MLREFGMYAAVGLGDRYHVLARRMADHVASRHAGTPRPAHELDAIMDEFEELQRTMHARAPEVQASAIAPPPPPKGWDDIVAEGGFAALHRLKQEDPERFAKVLRDHQIAEGTIAAPPVAPKVTRDSAGRAWEDLRYHERAALRESDPDLAQALHESWIARGEPLGSWQG